MKIVIIAGIAAFAALLALYHPAAPPAIASVGVVPKRTASSQRPKKGHPLPGRPQPGIVYVAGAVNRPGLYRVLPGARVDDAIESAGGLRRDADPVAVNLAEHVSDGDEIRVVRIGETPACTPHSRRKAPGRKAAAPDAAARIDVNAADQSTLATIPGIGTTLAARIVEYRRVNGPFASVDELADVAGMTQRRIDAMAAYVTVTKVQ